MHNHSTAKIIVLISLLRQEKVSVFAEHVIEKHGDKFEYDRCSGFRMNIKETHKVHTQEGKAFDMHGM